MLSNKNKYSIFNPKKRFSQNFLVDDNISKKIVSFMEIKDNDFIIEIGPGKGALTKHIYSITDSYLGIEIDFNSAGELKEKKFNIEIADFLKYDFKNLDSLKDSYNLKIIGNIPYHITSDILFKLLDNSGLFDLSVLMIQKEVAERIVANPNSKQYGILSVQFQALSEVKIIYNIPPTAFFPKPNVSSSIVRFSYRNKNYSVKNIKFFKAFVRAAFSKRRKTLKNSLNDFAVSKNIDLTKFEFDFQRRAESLSIEEFVNLSNDIFMTIS